MTTLNPQSIFASLGCVWETNAFVCSMVRQLCWRCMNGETMTIDILFFIRAFAVLVFLAPVLWWLWKQLMPK